MTIEEKWSRIDALIYRIRQIEFEWESLVREHNDLLGRHPKSPEPPLGRKTTQAQAEVKANAIHKLKASGLTQQAIAAELGISRAIVAYYLRASCKATLRLEAKGQLIGFAGNGTNTKTVKGT